MDDKLSEEELQGRLDEAAKSVVVGALYKHYRGGRYVVLNLAILESNNEICVIYQAQYGKQLTFIRPVHVWHETVEVDGQVHPRFSKIGEGNE